MTETQTEKFDYAVEVLLDRIRPTTKFDEALKYTQALENLAQAKAILMSEERMANKKRASA